MASYEFTLQAPSERSSPYIVYEKLMTGADYLTFFGSDLYGVASHFELHSLFITLICDATVANRYPAIQVKDVGTSNTFQHFQVKTAITASATKYAYLSKMGLNSDFDNSVQSIVGLADKGIVLAGTNLKVLLQCVGGVAGDSYSIRTIWRSISSEEMGIAKPIYWGWK